MLDISNETIHKCTNGVKSAQREIYEKLYPTLYPISLRYCNCKNDASDILQDAFIKIFNNLHKFKFVGSFEGWAKRVLVNTALDAYRSKKRRKEIYKDDLSFYENNVFSKEDSSFLDCNKYKDISHSIILEELHNMSNAYKNVFNLYIMEDYTHKEIADLLNIKEGTSKSNLHKAKKQMCNNLKKYIKNG